MLRIHTHTRAHTYIHAMIRPREVREKGGENKRAKNHSPLHACPFGHPGCSPARSITATMPEVDSVPGCPSTTAEVPRC